MKRLKNQRGADAGSAVALFRSHLAFFVLHCRRYDEAISTFRQVIRMSSKLLSGRTPCWALPVGGGHYNEPLGL